MSAVSSSPNRLRRRRAAIYGNAAGHELLWPDILAVPRLGNIQRHRLIHLRPIFRFDDFIRAGTNFDLRRLGCGFMDGGIGGYCEYTPMKILRDALCDVLDCFCYGVMGETALTDDEWTEVHNFWPNLARCQTRKMAPATTTYNCLAWTINDTSNWVWLEADANGNGKLSVSELNQFYSARGITNISYYGPSTSDVVHVAKKSGGTWPGCMASSKLGSMMRMAHDRVQLEGGVYQNIVGGN